jgi:hypothetical protein
MPTDKPTNPPPIRRRDPWDWRPWKGTLRPRPDPNASAGKQIWGHLPSANSTQPEIDKPKEKGRTR